MEIIATTKPSLTIYYNKTAFFLLYVTIVLAQTTDAFGSLHHLGNETDKIALVAIKAQLIDNNPRGVLSSWNDSLHHCDWEGIICGSKHKRVIALELYSRRLSGTISPFIGNLTFLKHVRFFNNSLFGGIPREIGYLPRLEYLVLFSNALTGEFPANFSACKNFQVLNIGMNKLEGKLTPDFGTLPQLSAFAVHDNNFSGTVFDAIANSSSLSIISAGQNDFRGTIPDSIGMMQNLTFLGLGANQFSGTVPTSIFNISSLQILELVQNNLQGELPADIALTLPLLTKLNLAGNYFSGSIPSSISNLTALYDLSLGGNQFTGMVPHDIGQLHSLLKLDLGFNHLTGNINFISTLANCTALQFLDLRETHLSGALPESLANLSTALTWLSVGSPYISGTIPIGIANLINLVTIMFGGSEITGPIPPHLGKIRNLQTIVFPENKLMGQVPESFGNLSQLGRLDLSGNKLQGSIPSSLGNCQYLIYLDLSNNDLQGSLPNQVFGGSAKFVELNLSHNHFEGPIPSQIRNQISMVRFDVSDNKLSDELPEALSECSALQQLRMQVNSFYGSLPQSFSALRDLQILDVSCNNLTGQIPVYLSQFSLGYLNLSYNNLEGRVPTMGVFANSSAVSLAGNSRLCGGILKLQLRPCLMHQKERKGKRMSLSRALKIVLLTVSALVGLLILIIMGACFCFTRSRKITKSDSTSSVTTLAFLKVSYNMLLKATDNFSSENLLGVGSYGSVFKGILDGKTVAVKVLNLQRRGGSKSFVAECKALRNVRHRNLVGVITSCSSTDFKGNDFKALVYEFMSNGSLDEWLHGDGNLTLLQRVDIAIDVAHALNYLHHDCEIPIVHCDLKPCNVLLDNDMVAHVGDFGQVKFLAQPQHPHQSSSTGIGGTCGYAAPEYGLGGTASPEGDLFSYGVLVLELVTGKRPTDNMFKDGFTIHNYAKEVALPDQVVQILDPTLENTREFTEEDGDKRAIQERVLQRLKCIEVMVVVGVACSNHLPKNRMRITDAISKLRAARDYLSDTTHTHHSRLSKLN